MKKILSVLAVVLFASSNSFADDTWSIGGPKSVFEGSGDGWGTYSMSCYANNNDNSSYQNWRIVVPNIAGSTSFEYKFVKNGNDWDSANSSNRSYTITSTEAVDLEICFVANNNGYWPWFKEISAYYVTGNNGSVFGSTWNAADENNKMTRSADGKTWSLVKESVMLKANTTVEYKVTTGGWGNDNEFIDKAWLQGNATLTIPEDGTYKVTFTFDPMETTTSATAEKTGGYEISSYSVLGTMTGGWEPNDNDMTLGSDGKYTYTLEKFTASASDEYQYRSRANHTWGIDDCPTTGNKFFNFPADGTYKLEFVFDPNAENADDRLTLTATRFQELTVGKTGFATFSTAFAAAVPDGVEAYYINGVNADGKTLSTQNTTVVPATAQDDTAAKGIIVKATPGTYKFMATDDVVALTDNLLYGTGDWEWNLYSGSTYEDKAYVFANGDEGVGFYKANTGTFAPNKAFLVYDGATAKGFFGLEANDNATAIDKLQQENANNGDIYSLQGVKMSAPQKGIFIQNGKKVVIK